ncbi:hypothetical protein Pelo_19410 [Pelomyxa schiedti]|nr:hypothetical protein Pelo_19410 [Pelomyxa schiedti]
MTPCLSAKNVMHHVNTQALRQPPKTNIADVKVDSKALCVKIPQNGSKSKSSSESKSGSGKGNRGLKIGIGLLGLLILIIKIWGYQLETVQMYTENATRPTGAITTRGQLGALAAGATVNRCGADSPMQRVMGRDHASSFLRILWFDVVLPTIRLFVLDVRGSALRDGALRQKETGFQPSVQGPAVVGKQPLLPQSDSR